MIHCLLHFKVSVPQCNCEDGAFLQQTNSSCHVTQTLMVGVAGWILNQPHWSPSIESSEGAAYCDSLGLIVLFSQSPNLHSTTGDN